MLVVGLYVNGNVDDCVSCCNVSSGADDGGAVDHA